MKDHCDKCGKEIKGSPSGWCEDCYLKIRNYMRAKIVWKELFGHFLVGDIVRIKEGKFEEKIGRVKSLSEGWDPVLYCIYPLEGESLIGWFRGKDLEFVAE